MILLEGLKTAKKLNSKLKDKIDKLTSKPRLEIILIGNDDASESYVRAKIRTLTKMGIIVNLNRFNNDIDEDAVYDLIVSLNNNNDVHGILLQLPIPKHLNEIKLIEAINYKKDVDGFHTINQGLLFQKRAGIRPATPKGILMLLDEYNIKVEGLNIVIVGRSQIVGAPLSKMLLDRNATVTVCHSKTKDLNKITKRADLLVSAIGKANFITSKMVKKGVIVIDVGINRLFDKIVGDVDFKNVSKKVSYITPVPKGVGPMTICALAHNLYEIYLEQKGDKNV